ncbi:MAG: hypothetical protein KAR20_07470, partial [Candidatus Heimdallarchaeota archaeon]|nr:hypothetical protein [Candidatus Heimdallarchaeota archaeon]
MQRDDLLIRAIPGHAGSGHCAFSGKKAIYPNTMSVDVVNALSKHPDKYGPHSFKQFADRSQAEINDVVYWLESFFSSPEKNRFANALKPNMANLSDMHFLKGYQFNMIEAVRGFYFAANMDNYDPIRKSVYEKYGFKMGGGKTYAVDINVLKKYNISLKNLASAEYTIPFLNFMDNEKRVELFKEMGIIIDNDFNLENIDPANLSWDSVLEQGVDPTDHPDKDLRKIYIRNARGNGLADDVAIALAGFLPQTFTYTNHQGDKRNSISRHIGAFFGDRIDTLEKDSSIIIPGGQDEIAGEYLNLRFKKFCQDHKNRKSFNIRNLDDNDYHLIS